jgi:peptidoglycan/xylan/chitin deacetylase (PgdA/CDA1 family)
LFIRPLLLGVTLAATSALAALADPCPGNPDALGTSRTIELSTTAPLKIGLRTYPQTLALEKGEVVLTFDDGPLPATTGPVLDALKHECVQATFFLIGRNAQVAPAVVRREVAEGHTVGHHSMTHPAVTLRGMSDASARRDIDLGFQADDMAAYGSAGAEPHVPFFRFPGFADTATLDDWLGARHIGIFGADLWASDWIQMTPEKTLDLLMTRLHRAGKGIILLHDARHQTAVMMPALLRRLKAEGYRVVHIKPGATEAPLEPAPPGWTSETEATVQKLLPGLMATQARQKKVAHLPLAQTAAGLETLAAQRR